MHGIERNILKNRKFATLYVRSTLHEKTELLQKRQFWVSRLSIPLCKLF